LITDDLPRARTQNNTASFITFVLLNIYDMVKKVNNSFKTSVSKRNAILNIASDIFLRRGYQGASVNEMSRKSGISKETFYRYFKNKEDLFLAVIDKELQIYWDSLSLLDYVEKDEHALRTLSHVGTELIKYLVSDRTMALRKLIFNECANHPKIGRTYYSHGPDRAYKAMKKYFDRQKKKGVKWRLSSRVLAENFVSLLLHKLTVEQQCRIKPRPSLRQIRTMTGNIARDFVIVYREDN
jgi:AcrR family transcriptional regulator